MLQAARELDWADPLAAFAAEFAKPPGTIYLDGNSLGLLCRPAEAALRQALEDWRTRAILGWTDGPAPWFSMSRQASALLAPLLGAQPEDVMIGQSATVNLHQLLTTFHLPDSKRPRVLIDEQCFPTDRYATASYLRLRGHDPKHALVAVPNGGSRIVDEARLVAAMGGSVGMAVLPSVVYTTGQLLDVAGLNRAARERGVLVIWDCSHSAGAVEHRFAEEGVELAFGCTYKHLNGGPGSPGFLFVHQRLREAAPGLAGWFGSDQARQFDMGPTFHPADDTGRYLIGTPHVLSLAPLVGALELIGRAGLPAIRGKSLQLTAFLRQEIETRLGGYGAVVVTPRGDAERGAHIAVKHPEAGRLSRALRLRGVIPDFRLPDLLRLAPAPLYTSFAECAAAVDVLEDLLRTGAHLQLPEHRDAVT